MKLEEFLKMLPGYGRSRVGFLSLIKGHMKYGPLRFRHNPSGEILGVDTWWTTDLLLAANTPGDRRHKVRVQINGDYDINQKDAIMVLFKYPWKEQ